MKRPLLSLFVLVLFLSCEESSSPKFTGNLAGYAYYSGTTIPVSDVIINIENKYDTTGTDGYFILYDLPGSSITLTATKDGYDQYQTTVTIAENENNIEVPMTSSLYTNNLIGIITDNDLQSLSNVNVTVLNDDSTDSQLLTTSDESGYYQIPGVPLGQRKIKFQKEKYETIIVPILMSDSDNQYNAQMESIYGTLTDIDGNTYQTIKIGDQIWMAENLKVTHYRNGDSISTGLTNSEWRSTSAGAYAVYDDNENHVDIYGYLYNWYAANDNKNIAPSDWHVSTDNDWQTLIGYLGGSDIAGNKLKEAGTTHWMSPNTGTTNESGFTALPGGARNNTGIYEYLGEYGIFWSPRNVPSQYGWHRLMNYDYSDVYRYEDDKNLGYSVRCIKD